MIVVADTSPLLHLARIGRLTLVAASAGPVVVPRSVWNELLRAGTRPDVAARIGAADWITVAEDPPAIDIGLDPGETSAILLAESQPIARVRSPGRAERVAPVGRASGSQREHPPVDAAFRGVACETPPGHQDWTTLSSGSTLLGIRLPEAHRATRVHQAA
jgi:hypothetical protein